MNRYSLPFCLVLFLFSHAWSAAPNSAVCEITIFQRDTATKADIPLVRDTVTFFKGIRSSAFLSAFSVEIELTELDSLAASFATTVSTLGPLNSTRSRQFTVEYSLPARITDIAVKPDAFYRLDIVPLYAQTADTSECAYKETELTITPSANLDIYYFPGTMGDYFLPGVKGLIETVYDRAKTLFGLTLPGKYHLFLCPCPIRSAIWDKRFGLSTNPLRSNAYVIYTKEFNAADPFPVIHTALLRSWGYAPAPLIDGLASFYTLSLFDMKTMVPAGRYLSLDTLLNTASYVRAEPYVADRSAASFFDFLTRTYGLGKIQTLYHEANDLNLRAKVEQVFGQKLPELEKTWLKWIDTTHIEKIELAGAAGMAESMFDYPRMQKLAEALTKLSANRTDSIRSVDMLERAYFSNGEYTRAVETQKILTNIQAGIPQHWLGLGSYMLMAGEDTGKAMAAFRTAHQLDTGNATSLFNTALLYTYIGNKEAAIDLLLKITSDTKNPFAEAKILLADLMYETGRKDKDPIPLYKDAIQQLEQVLQAQRSPYLMAWIGHAYLGLGDTENAYSYLATALLLETRPFYAGLIHLWLGNLMDQLGERDAAKVEYQNVLAIQSAAFTKKQAETYLTAPYSLKP